MRVKQMPIGSLKPYPGNPRVNKGAIEKVAASIGEFGWRQPIVADEDQVIIVGHTRWEAAKLRGEKQVPVHTAEGLTEEQKQAYRLADNRLNEYAKWDEELLAVELQDLVGKGFDMRLTGFSVTQLRKYTAADLSDDQLPEGQKARCKDGDLWKLGSHLVLCGDATALESAQRLFGEERLPVMMVTDPPYGVNYDPSWREDNTRDPGIKNDDRADWREAWSLFPGDVAYVWHGALHTVTVAASLEAMGFKLRSHIIWAKPKAAMSRGHYHWQHEPCMIAERHDGCWYSTKNGRPSHWTGSRGETTLWEIENEAFISEHPTQKPVECMGRPIMNSSGPGDYVYDPFLGTGTTVIAAERTGRRCLGLELDPKYVDVVLARWEAETGNKAEKL